ncbi:MAG: bifunctional peroxiredoxin/serine/threonine-protein kinase, partial [Planctomycetaceae bacterium]|nr:bifunctional peroxiredoxin/serine/threonine-protein kinase [Planctomycetaceae bacterium]
VPFRKSAKSEGIIVGTPSYMSPEQFGGKAPIPESDWFSLGCVLYELAMGEKLLYPANVLDLGHIFANWNMDFILESL